MKRCIINIFSNANLQAALKSTGHMFAKSKSMLCVWQEEDTDVWTVLEVESLYFLYLLVGMR